MKFINIICCFLILSSCQLASENEIQSNQDVFFDIEQYIDQELDSASYKQIEKSIVFNTKEEIQLLDSFDIKKELSFFLSSNINKTAWMDNYTEIVNKDGVTYEATNKKMKTKKVTVHKAGDKINKVVILNEAENTIFDMEQILTYTSGEGFTIELIQKPIASESNNSTIDVSFVY